MRVQDSRGIRIELGEAIKRGGEARIFEVKGKPNLVAKVYHEHRTEREAKLKAMLAKVPVQPATHTAIAWPMELLYERGQLVGFLMPKISGYEPIIKFYNPALRKKQLPGFDWRYLHRTATNLAVVIQTVHEAGHLIGDLNESNILVNDQALVTLVDADSFQIAGPKGQIFRCAVGKPEYTPPELHRVSFQLVNRRPEHDHFGLAVLIFQLLMQGYHPFSGVLPAHLSVGRVDVYGIKNGLFPYYQNHKQSSVEKPPNAPPFALLHPELQALFIRCFVDGHRSPTQRPTAREWRALLQKAERALVTCERDPTHLYSNHLAGCPFCTPEPAIQKPLPPAGQKRIYQTISAQIGTPSSSLGQAVPELVQGLGRALQNASRRQLLQTFMLFVAAWLTINVAGFAINSLTGSDSPPIAQPPASETVVVAPEATKMAYPEPNEEPVVTTAAYPEPAVTTTPEPAATTTPELVVTPDVWKIREVADLAKRNIKEVVYSPDGKWLAVAFSTGISLIDSQTLEQVRFIKTDIKSWVSSMAFSPDSQLLASGSWDGTARLWSTDGRHLATLQGHTSKVTRMAFSPDSKIVASASKDQTVRLWSTDGTHLKTLEAHTSTVTSVSFSPDGQTVASASHDRTVRLWSTNGTLLQTLSGHTSYVNDVAFSPDGKIVASASHDKSVRLWSTDGTLLATLSEHTDWVNRLAFSPDGETLASASNDQTIRLWSTNGAPLYILSQPSSWLNRVAFSPDGKTLLSASSDGIVRLWGLPP